MMSNSVVNKFKYKGIIYLFLVFLLMAGSTMAWLYFDPGLPKKTPFKAKQVFHWHNNSNSVQTIAINKT